ncbi:MAG: hypothetical protein ACP5N3_05425 [Candidatus Nanoarchaeia archaeon]
MKIIKINRPLMQVQEELGSFNLDIYNIKKYDGSKLFLEHESLDYNLEIGVETIVQKLNDAGLEDLNSLKVAEERGKPNMILYGAAGIIAKIPGIKKNYFLKTPRIFEMEKDFRANRGQHTINGWKDVDITEQTIAPVIYAVNSHPQLYTSGWSHSGVPGEVKSYTIEGFFIFKFDKTREEPKVLINNLGKIPFVYVNVLRGTSAYSELNYPAIRDPQSSFDNYVCSVVPTAITDEEKIVQYKEAWNNTHQAIIESSERAKAENHKSKL